ncbi:MAG: hypothetical protein R3281_15825 [Balneolaceae bacterium]|nr:hypothetical protein [Balneolaceae bacterium]
MDETNIFIFGVFMTSLFLVGIFFTIKEFRDMNQEQQRKWKEERRDMKIEKE